MKYLYLTIIVLLFSCSGKQHTAEIKDKDLLIQLSSKDNLPDTEGLEYNIRIFPLLKNNENDMQQLRKKMSYNIDSCFYRYEESGKQYPDGVIPVVNGIKNCFEYVVIFSTNRQTTNRSNVLTYQDKYINGKTYQLSLK